jgi:hypothetical protein
LAQNSAGGVHGGTRGRILENNTLPCPNLFTRRVCFVTLGVNHHNFSAFFFIPKNRPPRMLGTVLIRKQYFASANYCPRLAIVNQAGVA